MYKNSLSYYSGDEHSGCPIPTGNSPIPATSATTFIPSNNNVGGGAIGAFVPIGDLHSPNTAISNLLSPQPYQSASGLNNNCGKIVSSTTTSTTTYGEPFDPFSTNHHHHHHSISNGTNGTINRENDHKIINGTNILECNNSSNNKSIISSLNHTRCNSLTSIETNNIEQSSINNDDNPHRVSISTHT
ncbi:hypothetical protein BLOT_009900 [Blomia tropicalis]|nr:hypothetical protein BLOT_009900 [Blomia tropicalis]